MSQLDIQQQQQFTLLRRRGVDPETAREIVLGELTPEAKSGYPETTGTSSTLPGRFGVSNWPTGLTLEHVSTIGRNGRLTATQDPDLYETAGNSAVLASINTIALACTEAPIVVKRESVEEGGQLRLQVVRTQRIYKLLRRPNLCQPDDPDSRVFMPLTDMVWLREYCLHVEGNAYWWIIRMGDPLMGLPIMLIPIMPFMVEPVTIKRQDGTSKDYISYYAYAPSPDYVNNPIKISPRNMLHFRYGRDPKDLRKGLGLVKHLYREVYRDDLATRHTNTLLRHGAVPGLVVTPAEGTIEEDEAREAKARLTASFSGDEMGSIAVLSRGAKVEQFGFNPDQMNLAGFHKHAEERVAAVLNVPAMVAQLGAGLEQAAQFSNFHEAREMFAENTVLPRLRAANDVLSDLMRDFTTDEHLRLVHDEDQVRALQVDVSERFMRLQVGVGGGWVTANEARAQVGMPPIVQTQKVPLTQGQDNRLNTLTEAGLITLNEARTSVGLDPVEGGDVSINDWQAQQAASLAQPAEDANELPPPQEVPGVPGTENADPAAARLNTNNPKNTKQAVATTQGAHPLGLRVNVPAHTRSVRVDSPIRRGRQGANIGTKSRAGDLERLFDVTDPDTLLKAWRELREEGLSLAEVAFPQTAEA